MIDIWDDRINGFIIKVADHSLTKTWLSTLMRNSQNIFVFEKHLSSWNYRRKCLYTQTWSMERLRLPSAYIPFATPLISFSMISEYVFKELVFFSTFIAVYSPNTVNSCKQYVADFQVGKMHNTSKINVGRSGALTSVYLPGSCFFFLTCRTFPVVSDYVPITCQS